jgi:predicted phage-related endonuclease
VHLLMTADEVTEDRARWHKTRAGDDATGARVGGSDISGIMGLPGAHSSPYKVWMVKTGRWPDDDGETTDAMDFGTYCEPWSRRILSRDYHTLHFTDGGLYANDTRPWQIATFDLLTHPVSACVPVEGTHDLASPRHVAACTGPVPATATVQQKNDAFHDWHKLGLPPAYRAQALWEASVAGVDMAYLAPFDRVAVKTVLYEVPVDGQAARDLELMIEGAEWLRDLIRRDTPPPVDGHPATAEALRRRWSIVDKDKQVVVPWRIARAWRRAGQAETRAKARKSRWGNELRDRGTDAAELYARNPATGELVKVATRRIGDREAYQVDYNPRIDTLAPNQAWKP